jgi:Mn-dependent DtxR family transcriptional regulator
MKQRIELGLATYGPIQFKSFEGALDSFFANEVPQIGGSRTRQLLVQLIQELVGRFYPQTTHLRQGQVQWTAVHKLEKASYGKRITQSRLTPVILDLVQPQDALDRAGGKKLREVKQDAVVRLFQQAYQQDGVLTNSDLAVLLKISPSTVSHYAREWEKANDRYLPRRGVIHDIGPTLTHKRQIVRMIVLEGRKVEDVCRATDHSPEAAHRYLKGFKQVLLCHQKGFAVPEIAYAVKMSQRLVREYLDLIAELADDNRALKALLQETPLQ